MSSNRWSSLPVLVGGSLIALLVVLLGIFQGQAPAWFVYVIAFPIVILAAIFHNRIIFLTFWALLTLIHTFLDIGFGGKLLDSDTAQWGGLLFAGLTVYYISSERQRVAYLSGRRIRELEVMNEISREISSELELNKLLQKIVDRAVKMLDVTLGELLMLDKKTGELKVVAQYPLHTNLMGYPLKPGQSAMGRVAVTKEPLIINDYKAYEVATGIESIMDVPLIKGREFIGVLRVGCHTKNHHFTQDDLSLLTVLASQATIAIQNARLYQEVQHLAFTDGLTGINNRRRLFELAGKEHSRAMRYRRPLSVMLMDIDHFKSINDRHGHAAGDAVLKWLAGECSAIIRQKIDIIGRFGGEEFAVLYPETGLPPALEAAGRIRNRVVKSKVKIEETEIQITVSMGIASLPAAGETTLDQLIERADKALYAAKQKRDCIAYWDMTDEKPYLID